MNGKLLVVCALIASNLNLFAMMMNELPYRTDPKTAPLSGPLDDGKIANLTKRLNRKPAVIRCNKLSLEDLKKLLPLKDRIIGFNMNYCPKINSLEGLSAFPNIEVMQITGQDREWDLGELAKMKKLKVLDISSVKYKNMDFLKPLNTLEELTFFMQPKGVSDLSWTKGKTKLRVLKFYSMRCDDITPLSELSNLELLSLYMVFPKSVAPLAKLKKLKWLDLYAVNCKDLSPVGECTDLRYLDLYMTEAEDYSFLGKLAKLEQLSATFCDIDSLAFLKTTPNLKSLAVYQSKKITNWADLKGAKNLEGLAVSNTSFKDLSLLSGLNKLKALSFSECKITDFSALKTLTSLKRLNLENATIQSLDPVLAMSSLEELDLRGAANIKSILPLAKCEKLRSLKVSKRLIPAEEIESLKATFKEKKRYLHVWAP